MSQDKEKANNNIVPEKQHKQELHKLTKDEQAFLNDVDTAIIDKGSGRTKTISIVLVLLIFAFIAWASFATVDEITRGQGQVISSSRTQVITHLEGGILSEISVREGSIVEAGQVLAKVENVGASSSIRDIQNKIWEHAAAITRLEAELNETDLVFPEDLEKNAPHIVAAEKQAFEARKQRLESELSVQTSQIEQKQYEIEDLRKRQESTRSGLALASRRLELSRPMLEQKLFAEVDFINIQQEVVRLRGELASIENAIPKTQAAIAEAESKKTLYRDDYNTNIIAEINKRMSEKTSLEENLTTGTDRVTRTEIRSPMKGIVNRIILNTKGGVVKPGEAIMEITPIEDTLLVEVKIRPSDISFIYPNQKAVVKLTAYDYSIFGGLDAQVEQIGSDTIEGRNNDYYYLVKLRTSATSLEYNGKELPIIPGMIATVDILTGKKTIMQYLLKPIIKAKDNALRER